MVYDQFLGHQWGVYAEEISLAQVRGIFGYALSECNEVGVWGAFHVDEERSASDVANLRAQNQANVYLRHNFAFGGTGMLYTGVFDPADTSSWQVGFLGDAPLNDAVSLYANCNVVLPGSATGIVGSNELLWNFGVGVMVSLGAKSQAPTVSGHAGMPLLPVANNGSFLIGY